MINLLLDNNSSHSFTFNIGGINEDISGTIVPSESGLLNSKGHQTLKLAHSPRTAIHEATHYWIKLFPIDVSDQSLHIFLWLSLFYDNTGSRSSCFSRIVPEGRAIPSSTWIVTGKMVPYFDSFSKILE